MEPHNQPKQDEVGVGLGNGIECELFSGLFDQDLSYADIDFSRQEITRVNGSKLIYISAGFGGEGAEARIPEPFEVDICHDDEEEFVVGRLMLAFDQESSHRLIYAEELRAVRRGGSLARRTFLVNLDVGLIKFGATSHGLDRLTAGVPSWVTSKTALKPENSENMDQRQKDILCQVWNKEANALGPVVDNR